MECFNKQIAVYRPITEDIYDKIIYKRVWSGELMLVGDTVLYAYVFDPKDDRIQIKLMSLLDRELDAIGSQFEFVGYKNKIIPVLKYKNDNKKREYKDEQPD